MAEHSTFRYTQTEAFLDAVRSLGLDIRWQEDLTPLRRPVAIGRLRTPNSLTVQPMEGSDGQSDGSPGELTHRRYERFGAGGAGLIWGEATAVVPEGRANPRQLWIHRENVGAFAELALRLYRVAAEANGSDHRPVTLLQLTHSGRYSRPVDAPEPVIAYHHPYLPAGQTDVAARVISDEELAALEERYVEAAVLAAEAGFDGVDVKACHRYLINELLSAHTRPGIYGGSFENRTRFLRNLVEKIRRRLPDLIIGVRLSVYDAMPYPYGWGVGQESWQVPDLTEPIALARTLRDLGVSVLNVTIGNPYYNPHINRPFDQPLAGAYVPDEHPLEGVHRLIQAARQMQEAIPDLPMVGSGYSWLRNHLGHVGAANITNGWVTLVGVGREAFSYPNFARDLLGTGRLDHKQICIACSKCTQLMRDHMAAGCVPHDKEVYLPLYREGRKGKVGPIRGPVSDHL